MSSVQFVAAVADGDGEIDGEADGVAVAFGFEPYVPLISMSLAKFVSTPKKPNAVSI